MTTVANLKKQINKYNLVSGISKLRKEELTELNKNLECYNSEKQNYDYRKYKFKDKTITVNDEQYNVITSSKENNIRIIACAGSGKTTTIICRMKYLIDNGVDPQTILFTTFNVDAASNMRQKINDLFGFMPMITIGTIDSISARFYYKYFCNDYFVGVKEYSIELLKFLKSSEGDIILNQYQYIFFDEFQDVNQIQYDILMCFYNKGSKIVVIGDDAQNVYQFRNSNVNFIINLGKYVQNLVTHNLLYNYRSTPEIIRMANESILLNKNQIKKEMLSINDSTNFTPKVSYYDSYKIQNKNILNTILEFKKKGFSDESIAIVSRNNRPLKLIEEFIEKSNSKNEQKIKYVSLITEDNVDTKPKIKNDHLTITTIHKAKGLEWNLVFVIGCSDDFIPSKKDNLSLEEERRLFYVAITRAKHYLYISFVRNAKKNNGKIPFVTRFIQELPPICYDFENKKDIFFNLSSNDSDKFETSVTGILKMFNEQDIMRLRFEKIIPQINPIIRKIHSDVEINSRIKENFWEADWGNFIDRYISREIGFSNVDSGGLLDNCAIAIIHPCLLSNNEYSFFLKYENNFRKNIRDINKFTEKRNYLRILNKNDDNSSFFKKIKKCDESIIENIISRIINISIQHKIELHNIHVTTENKLPKKFREAMILSYNNYLNKNMNNEEVINDIYKVSLCSMISQNRRRLLHRNDTSVLFTENNKILFENIKEYVDSIKKNNLVCKKEISSEIYSIYGEVDLIDLDNCKIIDFKCSSSENFQFEWLLQLLAYTSLIKLNSPHPKNIINQIEIYNPIRGLTYTIDVSSWNKEAEFIKYMDMVRYRQNSRNLNSKQLDKENLIEKYQNMINCFDKTQLLYENEWIIDNLICLYSKNKNKLIYDQLLDYYDKNKNDSFKTELIDKISKLFNKKYMIIDTETSGLPEFRGYNMYYDYKFLNKYKNSRLIQLSWGIYNYNDDLIAINDYIIKPNGFIINNHHIHGITMDNALKNGKNIHQIFDILYGDLQKVEVIIAHNIQFDVNIIRSELFRQNKRNIIDEMNKKKMVCTLKCANDNFKKKKIIKSSKLGDLYKYFFDEQIENAHNSKFDVLNTGKIFQEMKKRKLIVI